MSFLIILMIIVFSNSYRNVYDRSAIRDSVLVRSDVIRNNVKLILKKTINFSHLTYYISTIPLETKGDGTTLISFGNPSYFCSLFSFSLENGDGFFVFLG